MQQPQSSHMQHPGAEMSPAQMMSGLSLQHNEQQPGLAPVGVAMPGYPTMQVPVAYVPGVGGVPQAVPGMQGMQVRPISGRPASHHTSTKHFNRL